MNSWARLNLILIAHSISKGQRVDYPYTFLQYIVRYIDNLHVQTNPHVAACTYQHLGGCKCHLWSKWTLTYTVFRLLPNVRDLELGYFTPIFPFTSFHSIQCHSISRKALLNEIPIWRNCPQWGWLHPIPHDIIHMVFFPAYTSHARQCGLGVSRYAKH